MLMQQARLLDSHCVAHQSLLPAHQPVEQRGLAHVGTAHQGNLPSLQVRFLDRHPDCLLQTGSSAPWAGPADPGQDLQPLRGQPGAQLFAMLRRLAQRPDCRPACSTWPGTEPAASPAPHVRDGTAHRGARECSSFARPFVSSSSSSASGWVAGPCISSETRCCRAEGSASAGDGTQPSAP